MITTKEMKATLTRNYQANQTKGRLVVSNGFECDTLELKWRDNQNSVSCIPEGTYKVVPRYSPKYKNHLHVLDVSKRSFILFHSGNYAGSKNPKTGQPDIRGCILVGKGYADINKDGIEDILSSGVTMKKLMDSCPDGFELTIK